MFFRSQIFFWISEKSSLQLFEYAAEFFIPNGIYLLKVNNRIEAVEQGVKYVQS